MNKTTSRLLTVAALVAAPTLVAVQPVAFATPAPTVMRFHLALSKTQPAANDTVAESPKTIKLWFTESVQLSATGVKITGAAKHEVPLSAITIAAAAKSPAVAEIKETLKPGKYTVDWKTMSADGHPNKGTFVFTVGKKVAH
jgi:copper resistance protein C